jgi:hypothetical protein
MFPKTIKLLANIYFVSKKLTFSKPEGTRRTGKPYRRLESAE